MKLVLFLGSWMLCFAVKAQSYTERLEQERSKNNLEMLFEVLDSTEARTFAGICYFPIDTSYVVNATFKRQKGKQFAMPMTKARLVYYRQYGTLTFKVHDTLCELAVYENMSLKGQKQYKNYLFMPFRDGTTALTTYGGGRYLDIEKTKGTTWKIDLNKAYHPYCVYSHRYSCPIPPEENTVAPCISAGECYSAEEEH